MGQCAPIIEGRLLLGNGDQCSRPDPPEGMGTIHVVHPVLENHCPLGRTIRVPHGTAKHDGDNHLLIGWDEYRAPLTGEMLTAAYEFYTEDADRLVFVHCAAGLHRSPTIVMALLMAAENYGPRQALRIVVEAMMCHYEHPHPPVLDPLDTPVVLDWAASLTD